MRLLLILFIAVTLLIPVGCGKKTVQKAEDTELSDADGEQTIKNFSLAGYTEAGKKKWEVEGAIAHIFNDVVNLSDIVAKAYGEEANVTLTAEEGVFDKNKKDVQLNKNVVALTDEGTKLVTDSLTWDADTDSIVTDRKVVVTKQNFIVEGTGATAMPGMKHVKLNSEVSVNIKPQTTVTCEGPLEVDYNKNIAYFNNNVLVEDERGKIYSDKMQVYFNPKTKSIDKATATGNVKIIRGENTTYSDHAVYTASDGKVVLTGSPKLVIYRKEDLTTQE